jgi:hypothetical protein
VFGILHFDAPRSSDCTNSQHYILCLLGQQAGFSPIPCGCATSRPSGARRPRPPANARKQLIYRVETGCTILGAFVEALLRDGSETPAVWIGQRNLKSRANKKWRSPQGPRHSCPSAITYGPRSSARQLHRSVHPVDRSRAWR